MRDVGRKNEGTQGRLCSPPRKTIFEQEKLKSAHRQKSAQGTEAKCCIGGQNILNRGGGKKKTKVNIVSTLLWALF